MPQYIAKRIKDIDGNIVGYKMPFIVSGVVATKSDEDRFIHSDKLSYPKIDFVNNEWVVVEDIAAKDAADATELEASDLKKKMRTLANDLQSATTIAALKPIISSHSP